MYLAMLAWEFKVAVLEIVEHVIKDVGAGFWLTSSFVGPGFIET